MLTKTKYEVRNARARKPNLISFLYGPMSSATTRNQLESAIGEASEISSSLADMWTNGRYSDSTQASKLVRKLYDIWVFPW